MGVFNTKKITNTFVHGPFYLCLTRMEVLVNVTSPYFRVLHETFCLFEMFYCFNLGQITMNTTHLMRRQ